MPHVLVAGKLHPSGIELLRGTLRRDLRLCRGGLRAELCAAHRHRPTAWSSARSPFRPRPSSVPRGSASSRGTASATTRSTCPSLNERGIALAIVGDVNSVSVAEQAMMLLLAAAKRAIRSDRAVRDGGLGLAQPAGAERALAASGCSSSASAGAAGISPAWRPASAWTFAPSIRSSAGRGWPDESVSPGGDLPRGPGLGRLRLRACAEGRQAGDRGGGARGDEADRRAREHGAGRRGRRIGADRRALRASVSPPRASTSSTTSRRRPATPASRWTRSSSRPISRA